MKTNVIACVDGSPSTGAVCDYAAWAAAGLSAPLTLLHVVEKDGHPAVSDLSGIIGIDSKELFIEELVRVEGERNRLLMAQGEAILTACAERLTRSGLPEIRQLQMRGTLDEILAGLDDVRLMVLGRRGAEHAVGSQLESVIRLQKEPVLVVPETFSAPSRVLFAWDGSEASRRNLTRLTPRRLLPWFLLPQEAGRLALWLSMSQWVTQFYLIVTVISSAIASTLATALWVQLFGSAQLAKVRSTVEAGTVLASGASPVIMGVLIDHHVTIRIQAMICLVFILTASLVATRVQVGCPEDIDS